jgi:hypothetical protein
VLLEIFVSEEKEITIQVTDEIEFMATGKNLDHSLT